jgi:hypothetical protein
VRSFVADESDAHGEEQEQQPAQEELLRQLEAELEQLKVADVLVQTVFTVSSLGYRSLGDEHRDLDQAKLAIDALRALVPVMKDALPAELTRDFDQLVANMQLAYAKAAT